MDDDVDLGALISEFFTECGFHVHHASSSRQGLDLARMGRFDAVLLDVMMPGMDGFTFLEQLRRTSSVPVLMLTARTETSSRLRGFDAGADDYLPKPFEPQELLARVRAILRRAYGEKPRTMEVNGVGLDPGSRSVTLNSAPVAVTSIEYEILEVLLRNAGRVVSRDELTQRLYQRESTPFDRSIDVHVSHLRKKLDDDGTRIRTVRGIGYQFCLEIDSAGAIA